jgi:hypothetical protein
MGQENIKMDIYGPVVKQGKRRIRTNEELRELYEDLDIVADIKQNRLEWIRHIIRLDQGRTVKQIFESNPEGSRRGRPRLRWLEDIEKDLWVMKVKR